MQEEKKQKGQPKHKKKQTTHTKNKSFLQKHFSNINKEVFIILIATLLSDLLHVICVHTCLNIIFEIA